MMVHLTKLMLLVSLSTQCHQVSAATGVTYSRGDKNAYLTARGYENDDVSSLDPSAYKLLRKQLKQPKDTTYTYDDPQKCTIYIAESSIPNAGLGVYTTTPHPKDSYIGHPEIGILIHDVNHHYPNSDTSKDLFKNYVWQGHQAAYGAYEAATTSLMIPGIGMMVNDNIVSNNVAQVDQTLLTRFWEDGTDALGIESHKHDTMNDVGRGSTSIHTNINFRTLRDLEAGDEIFVSYGAGWFSARSGDTPEKEHFKLAYDTAKQFVAKARNEGLEVTDLGMQQRYEERIYKADWIKDRPRLKAALPESVLDIPSVLKMGAAAYSRKDYKRSVEWIEENGMCVDNIVPGVSVIPQAGRGAFALREIEKGGIVTTTPLITMTLKQIMLREEVTGQDWNKYIVHGGFQQILNYCYGHDESTLVFFPAAPTVNFINHGSKQQANAEIRWSSSPHHKAEWLDLSFSEMATQIKSGLIADIVATKDIKRGDEILLYYGETWEKSWDRQIDNWGQRSNFTDTLGVKTAADYNLMEKDSVIRTVFEQKTNPYPGLISTRCFFTPPESCTAPSDASKGVKCQVQSKYNATSRTPSLHLCDILTRYEDGEGGHWYTANVTFVPRNRQDKGEEKGKKGKKGGPSSSASGEIEYYLVDYMPRYAIRFVDKGYTKDQYMKGGFRQPIGIGEGMIPEAWLDLRANKKNDEL